MRIYNWLLLSRECRWLCLLRRKRSRCAKSTSSVFTKDTASTRWPLFSFPKLHAESISETSGKLFILLERHSPLLSAGLLITTDLSTLKNWSKSSFQLYSKVKLWPWLKNFTLCLKNWPFPSCVQWIKTIFSVWLSCWTKDWRNNHIMKQIQGEIPLYWRVG